MPRSGDFWKQEGGDIDTLMACSPVQAFFTLLHLIESAEGRNWGRDTDLKEATRGTGDLRLVSNKARAGSQGKMDEDTWTLRVPLRCPG